MKLRLRLMLALAIVAAANVAEAGRSCEQRAPDALDVQRAMTLAEHTVRRLDETGAQVVVLGRVGQDLSKYGQRYSHMGLAYRDG
jgi:hypothetical protein